MRRSTLCSGAIVAELLTKHGLTLRISPVLYHQEHEYQHRVWTQHWIRRRMEELEKARNFIAHNRMLLPSEFQRLYMYIGDWNRAIGL